MKGFYAYPSQPPSISQSVVGALGRLSPATYDISTWAENDIAGKPLIDSILENIETSDLLIADITRLNFNVTFEIGYAIAKSKRLLVTRNSSITRDPLIDLVGIFDTLGYKEYANDEELYSIIVNASSNDPLPINYPLNRRAPVYIVETPRRDQLTTTLVSKIKKARLKYRSFIAIEDTRMAAEDAIKNVASSFGVAIPLLSKEMEDAEVHNIRAAFVSGLAIGLGLPTLIVQHLKGPIPLDVRDFATTIKHPDDIVEAVNGFALDVTDKLQSFELEVQEEPGSLKSLSVGDPKAEDEFETLEDYFLQTDQYLKAERGEVSLIVGRKGTGKTAIFGHLRNRKRADSLNVVLDLKPEGYQLVKLREQILKRLSQGAKQHLIVAFWEYILFLELCNKLMEKDKQRHMTDHRLFKQYNEIRQKYGEFLKYHEADFSGRLMQASDHVIGEYQKRFGDEQQVDLSTSEITNLMYSLDLKQLRDDLSDYFKFKREIFILFDNLDRGWPEGGLGPDDVMVMRCLIDATRKLQREMRSLGHEFSCLVFLRNDVYQLLMRATPDFGKELQAELD
jgi:hypothetical protein